MEIVNVIASEKDIVKESRPECQGNYTPLEVIFIEKGLFFDKKIKFNDPEIHGTYNELKSYFRYRNTLPSSDYSLFEAVKRFYRKKVLPSLRNKLLSSST